VGATPYIENGLLDRSVFSDPDIYRREMEHVFGTSWLFVAHDSMLKNPGDYITTWMGEDPVIVSRDRNNEIRVLLNTCRHRGNRVCLFDRGNTDGFICSYHGWRYDVDGRLASVPYRKGAYLDELDLSKWGLVPAPRVATHGGLIFASWSQTGLGLDATLGDAAWYLDNLVLDQHGSGIDFVQGHYGYRVKGNWKIIAENFAGDHYHTGVTHRSSFVLGLMPSGGNEQVQDPYGPFEVSFPNGHGIGGVKTGEATYRRDLEAAAKVGDEDLVRIATRYVNDRYARMKKAMADIQDMPYGCSHGTIFPNFLFSGGSNALRSTGFYILHPKGALETEVWQWFAVDRELPAELRELLIQSNRSNGQSASGLFAQDDAENFERVTEVSIGVQARRVPLHLQMTLEHEGNWPGHEEWRVNGLPGLVGPHFSEHAQRGMYSYWASLVGR